MKVRSVKLNQRQDVVISFTDGRRMVFAADQTLMSEEAEARLGQVYLYLGKDQIEARYNRVTLNHRALVRGCQFEYHSKRWSQQEFANFWEMSKRYLEKRYSRLETTAAPRLAYAVRLVASEAQGHLEQLEQGVAKVSQSSHR